MVGVTVTVGEMNEWVHVVRGGGTSPDKSSIGVGAAAVGAAAVGAGAVDAHFVTNHSLPAHGGAQPALSL